MKVNRFFLFSHVFLCYIPNAISSSSSSHTLHPPIEGGVSLVNRASINVGCEDFQTDEDLYIPYYDHSEGAQRGLYTDHFKGVNPPIPETEKGYAIFFPRPLSEEFVPSSTVSGLSSQTPDDGGDKNSHVPESGFYGKKQEEDPEPWELVEDPAVFPNSIYGLLNMKLEGRTYFGSGVVIGDYTVLTAGHNLYFREYQTAPKIVEFYPGYKDGNPVPIFTVKYFIVHDNYVAASTKQDAENYDIGVIVFNEPIGKLMGFTDIKIVDPENLKDKITLIGYPGGKRMYEIKGTITPPPTSTNWQIAYMAKTGEGLSGGGGSIDGQGIHCIHTYGYPYHKRPSCGTRIRSEIQEWIAGIPNLTVKV